jgi:hypothetical protein
VGAGRFHPLPLQLLDLRQRRHGYAADGTSTAWQVYVAAHPDADVTQTFVVLDEEGTYNLDRISLGTGEMYQTAFGSAKRCTTESSC